MNHYLESLFSLQGKIAVVTGGGRGLGKGMAMGLAGAGAAVVLVSRTEKELKETVEEIRAKGGKADAYPADISKLDRIPYLVQSIHRIRGGSIFWSTTPDSLSGRWPWITRPRTGSASWM